MGGALGQIAADAVVGQLRGGHVDRRDHLLAEQPHQLRVLGQCVVDDPAADLYNAGHYGNGDELGSAQHRVLPAQPALRN